MNPIYAFTVIMLIWTISNYVSNKTKSMLSSLFVASLIFLIGFKSNEFLASITRGTIFETLGNTFSAELLPNSSLLALGQTVVGLVIVHLGTMISLKEFKKQIKTFIIGSSAVIGITIFLLITGFFLKNFNYIISGIAALTGGPVSIIIVQQRALELGLMSVAALPILIAAFQGIVGFPLSSIILKKEAKRLRKLCRSKKLKLDDEENKTEEKRFSNLPFVDTTPGALFWTGLIVLVSHQISMKLTNNLLHPFVIGLFFGVLLREIGLFRESILSGIDAFGLMMLSILIIVFGPLSSISISDLVSLIWPMVIIFTVGLSGNIIFSLTIGKLFKFSPRMAVVIGLTCLYGFPGTMILAQEAAKSVGENEEEIKAIESQILPQMIIAGFSTVTITSVIITGFIVSFMQ